MTVLLSLFLYLCSFATSEVFNITPSERDSCSLNFCLSLSDFVANFSDSLETSTMLIFQPGIHSLQSDLTVKQKNNFSMVASANNSSSIVLNCEKDARLYFLGVNNLHISGLAIKHCNGQVAHAVDWFTLENCLFVGHEYTALQLVYTNVQIRNCSFVSNSGGNIKKVAITKWFSARVGAAIIVSMTNATIMESIFKNNSAQTAGAIFGEWESNITIINSLFVENHAKNYGGVMYFEDGCTVAIHNSTFCNNTVDNLGGIVVVTETSLFLWSSNFDLNKAHTGGVMYAELAKDIIIRDCNFTENFANNSGGVLLASLTKSRLNIIDSNFNSNRAERYAGVFELHQNLTIVTHSHFVNNTAGAQGGVFAIISSFTSVSHSKLVNNSAGYAGVIYIDSIDITAFDNCEFTNNTANARGGVIITHHSNTMIRSSSFTGNTAFSGAVFHIQTESVVEVENVVIRNNSAQQGVWYCVDSTAVFSNDVHILENLGSLFLHYSKVYLRGNTTFVNNKPTSRHSEIVSSIHESGAITAFQSNIFIEGNCTLAYNSAVRGGAIYLTTSKIFITGNAQMMNNKATDSGGGVYLYQSEISCKRKSTFMLSNNSAKESGGGVHAISSIISVEYDIYVEYLGTHMIIAENKAQRAGGGMFLEVNSKLNILNVSKHDSTEAQYTTEFINNSADYGGAIYVDDDTNSGTCMSTSYKVYSTSTECFLQTLITLIRKETNLQSEVIANPINTLFLNNIAHIAGSTIFGGLLDRCSMSPFIAQSDKPPRDEDTLGNIDGITYLNSISNISDADSRTITSKPVKVCFCSSNQPNCNVTNTPLIIHRQVQKGKNFTVSLVAVDQVKNIISAVIYSSPKSNESGIGDGQLIQSTGENCTDLTYSISSPNDYEELLIYAEGPCKDATLSQGLIQIHFLPCTCSIGFEPNFEEMTRCMCRCDSKIAEYFTDCDPVTETLTRINNVWITNVSASSNNYLIFPNCPLNYCHPPSSSIKINLNTLNGADAQCAYNHSGILCGMCKSGLSLSLGSSVCIACPRYWPALLVVFLLAAILGGIVLVFFILFLNLTVAVGTINGIIFYAHIINAHSSTFLPFHMPNFITIFLAWLNLELGFDVCFFEGMDSFWKTLLHLMYPVYLLLLIIAIIVISERSTKFAWFIGKKNPVATLATAILLSYSKFLHLTIASLSFAILNYPDGSQNVVWLTDATVVYFRGKHMVLFLAALLILLVGSIYTTILFSWQWLLQYQHKKLLKWVQNQQLYMFLEPYHAPYTFKHRYWTGLLLLIRAFLYIISAANVANDPAINLLAIVIAMICLLVLKSYSQGKIYRKWSLDMLEITCYINLALFSVIQLFILEGNRNQSIIAYISGSFNIILFLVVLIYHIFSELVTKTRFWSRLSMRQKRNESEELHSMDLIARCLIEQSEPTHSEVAGPTQEQIQLDSTEVNDGVYMEHVSNNDSLKDNSSTASSYNLIVSP